MTRKIPLSGERAAMGGFLPQFDAFAWFVYKELIYDNLTWVRVADPKAEKLDDVQYSTQTEIHAYQIKWSNQSPKNPFSYNNFKELFLECISSWRSLKNEHTSENKKIIAHLLTNRPLSSNDSIKDPDTSQKIGTFNDFHKEVWGRLKIGQDIEKEWENILENLISSSGLSDQEFYNFIEHFEFQPEYTHHEFSISNLTVDKQQEDLLKISRFLQEEAADKDPAIEYSHIELINILGWGPRFKTTFNHELVVDKTTYQPISSTLDELNQKIDDHKGGYIFLVGGPGTGKSTLLTDWVKGKEERVIRYYTFDFNNPSSLQNRHERGEAENLFFDLVFQIKEYNIYKDHIQPYKNLEYLIEAFSKQLDELGAEYKSKKTKTIIVIDGLDHIPREYTKAEKSFLAYLPNPDAIPEGVYLVLGSQSYRLDDLKQEIKIEFDKGTRTVNISSLKRKEVFALIDSTDLTDVLSVEQKKKLFEKSQGHPLYLSYLIQNVLGSDDINDVIEELITIDGDINTYYQKIWEPIEQSNQLVQLLGLIARVQGGVNPDFIKEWNFDSQILKEFSNKAIFLFDTSQSHWFFFHVSFREFLIQHTSFDELTSEFDRSKHQDFHVRLANHYSNSSVERQWSKAYHLYEAGKINEYLEAASPDKFLDQLLDFRPVEEIKRDTKLGIEISKSNNDVYVLIRYLFALTELERRLFFISPVSFTEEFLKIGELQIAKNYIREGKTLLCDQALGLKAGRLFYKFGNKIEAKIIYNIAEPESIYEDKIILHEPNRYEEEIDKLEEWVQLASHFDKVTEILSKVNNIEFKGDKDLWNHRGTENDLRLRLLATLGYHFINIEKWSDHNLVLEEFDLSDEVEKEYYFFQLKNAIEKCTLIRETVEAQEYLSKILSQFPKDQISPEKRVYNADLIYKVTDDLDLVEHWVRNIPQPSVPSWDDLGYEGSLRPFLYRIKLNKLLNLCGLGIAVTKAVPDVDPDSDEDVVVQFERMLCLITEFLCDGLQNKPLYGSIKTKVRPIFQFYYKDISHHNSYWLKLKRTKSQYFDYLIYAISYYGDDVVNELGDYFMQEFSESSQHWPPEVQRNILMSLVDHGYDIDKTINRLHQLETFMLDELDVDGRIDECSKHAKVWLKLSDKESAKKWIKQAIKESLGIGYSKDYQFSSWIEWLQSINQTSSEDAEDRILWFLSHLKHIKETTDGSAYHKASGKLLQTTFQWNLSAGRQQLEWQLDNDLIHFEEAISIFISHFLEEVSSKNELDKIILLYTEILLYISTSSSGNILKSILSKGYQINDSQFLQDYLSDLVRSIKIKSLEELRPKLLSIIKGFVNECGLKITTFAPNFSCPEPVKQQDENESSNTLVLKSDSERLTEREVLDRITDFEKFKELVEQEDNRNSFFKWDKVIERITPQLTIEQIKELADINEFGRRKSDYFAKLSKCATKLGDDEVAKDLAEKAIATSNDYGWDKWADGGTRINAFLALQKIDNEYAVSKAFEYFTHDAIRHSNPGTLCEQLDNILPVITAQYDVLKVWDEIYDYLKRLMINSTLIKDLPELKPQDRPIESDLIDLVFYLSKSTASIISKKAIELLAKFFNGKNDYLTEEIRSLYSQSEEGQESFIKILKLCSVFGKENVLHHFENELYSLSKSHNYHIYRYATSIMEDISIEVPSRPNRELPEIYLLQIERIPKPDFGIEEDPLNPEFDLDDPEDLIKPYDRWITILEDMTGINKNILLYRMDSIMKSIDDSKRWTQEYEKEIKNHLNEINLKYAYSRPRAKAARRALMHLITELIDGQELDIQKAKSVFRFSDYYVYSFYELEKPSFIPKMSKEDESGVPIDWIEQINESDRLDENLIEIKDNWFIIGEYSTTRSLFWGKATEEYMSQISVKDHRDNESYYIFGSAFQELTEEYYELEINEKAIILIRDHFFNQFDLKSRWLAFNPVLARHLGWLPDKRNLFAWKDNGDAPMVRSVYWSNGNINMPPPQLYSEAGSGWYIIATGAAFDQIKEVESNLYIDKHLKRYKWDDGDFKENSIDKTISAIQ